LNAFTLRHVRADDGSLTRPVDVLMAIRTPANAQDAGGFDADVAVALESGQTATRVSLHFVVEDARGVRRTIGRHVARF
jgi:hypothetical protein